VVELSMRRHAAQTRAMRGALTIWTISIISTEPVVALRFGTPKS